jgi:hypothetical protein
VWGLQRAEVALHVSALLLAAQRQPWTCLFGASVPASQRPGPPRRVGRVGAAEGEDAYTVRHPRMATRRARSIVRAGVVLAPTRAAWSLGRSAAWSRRAGRSAATATASG